MEEIFEIKIRIKISAYDIIKNDQVHSLKKQTTTNNYKDRRQTK